MAEPGFKPRLFQSLDTELLCILISKAARKISIILCQKPVSGTIRVVDEGWTGVPHEAWQKEHGEQRQGLRKVTDIRGRMMHSGRLRYKGATCGEGSGERGKARSWDPQVSGSGGQAAYPVG